MGTASLIFKALDFMTCVMMNPKHIKEVICKVGKKYDLYHLQDKSTYPIIINIHGGGFMAGDKKYRRYWCEILANNGWFVINANYRLCPAVTIVEQIKDIWDILGDINTLANKYDLDKNTIVITGDSAGAFLATYMVALLNNKKLRQLFGIQKNHKLKISGALLYCGIYDLAKLIENKETTRGTGLLKEIAESITQTKYKDIQEVKYYKFYPYFSIEKFINKKWCPVQIFYSKKDMFVKGQGELFYKALVEKNIPVRRHYTNKFIENHCYHLNFISNVSKNSVKITLDFLDKIKNKLPL